MKDLYTRMRRTSFDEDDFTASHVDSLALIREVKKHEVIYNPRHEKFHDTAYRDSVWEQIYVALFPRYESYRSVTKIQIGIHVRRRWTSLRSSISREVKVMFTRDYSRKKGSPQLTELEYFIPYIGSPYCKKLCDKLGKPYYATDDTNSPDMNTNDSNTNDVDNTNDEYNMNDDSNDGSYGNPNETEQLFIHEIKEEEPFEYIEDTGPDISLDNVDSHFTSFEPAINYDSTCPTNPNENMPKCHPIISVNNSDNSINRPLPALIPKPSLQQNRSQTFRRDIAVEEVVKKRTRLESNDDNITTTTAATDLQQELLDLLINIEHRQLQRNSRATNDSNDTDRLFFLSLAPDFKKIPARKKILVKAKITAIIAQAMK